MQQPRNPLFDELARAAGGAMNALAGLKGEIEALIRQQMEKLMAGMDMIPREEFEVVRDMAAKARQEQEALEKRVAALEARLGEAPAAPAKPKKPAAPRKPKV